MIKKDSYKRDIVLKGEKKMKGKPGIFSVMVIGLMLLTN
jgi:hypothetical protein